MKTGDVLFVRFGAMGDILLTTPAIRKFKRQFPKKRISFLTSRANSLVLRYNSFIDKIYTESNMSYLAKKQFDIIYLLQDDAFATLRKSIKKNFNYKKLIEATEHPLMNSSIACRKLRGEKKIKFVDIYADICKIQLLPKERMLEFNIKKDIKIWFDLFLKINALCKTDYVTIAPSSCWKTKDFGVRATQKIVNMLRTEGYKVVLLSLSVKYKNIIGCINLSGKTTLRQAAKIILHSKYFIGIDSGLAHLADLFGKRMITFWTVTEPQHTLTVGAYNYPIVTRIECGPCYAEKCNNNNYACLQMIKTSFIKEIIRFLDNGNFNHKRNNKEIIVDNNTKEILSQLMNKTIINKAPEIIINRASETIINKVSKAIIDKAPEIITDKGRKKVSILIPTINFNDVFLDCLKSLVQKTKTDQLTYEVIIINNAADAKHRTRPRAEFLAVGGSDKRVRIIDELSNGGYPSAINKGISESTGEYVLFFNDDVRIIDPDWLNKLYLRLNKQGNGIVGALAAVAGKDYRFIKRFIPEKADGIISTVDKSLNYYLEGWCVFMARKTLEEVGYFDESFFLYCEDSDFSFRITATGQKMSVVNNIGLRHLGSSSVKIDGRKFTAAVSKRSLQIIRNKWTQGIDKEIICFCGAIINPSEDNIIKRMGWRLLECKKCGKLFNLSLFSIKDKYNKGEFDYNKIEALVYDKKVRYYRNIYRQMCALAHNHHAPVILIGAKGLAVNIFVEEYNFSMILKTINTLEQKTYPGIAQIKLKDFLSYNIDMKGALIFIDGIESIFYSIWKSPAVINASKIILRFTDKTVFDDNNAKNYSLINYSNKLYFLSQKMLDTCLKQIGFKRVQKKQLRGKEYLVSYIKKEGYENF